jgi:hypothetical protein
MLGGWVKINGRRQALSGVNLGASMFYTLKLGGHVLTPFFGTYQNDQSGQEESYCIRRQKGADENQFVRIVVDEWW